jgi:hypothetical protein
MSNKGCGCCAKKVECEIFASISRLCGAEDAESSCCAHHEQVKSVVIGEVWGNLEALCYS